MDRKELFNDLFGERLRLELGKYEPKNNPKQTSPEGRTQSSLKKEFKKLRHKALYLNMEYEELSEKFEKIKCNFIKQLIKYCEKRNVSAPLESKGREAGSKDVNSVGNINDIFREIVKKTHPDLNKNTSGEEQDQNTQLYNEAVEGKKQGNFRKILQVALELNVKIKNITPEFILQLKLEIKGLHDRMKSIREDVMFKWAQSPEEQKQIIFEIITKNQEPK
tara:strand:+ start:665 stop:1327 length:663 start_codon:yes stop_codon:yes gene_type:complete